MLGRLAAAQSSKLWIAVMKLKRSQEQSRVFILQTTLDENRVNGQLFNINQTIKRRIPKYPEVVGTIVAAGILPAVETGHLARRITRAA